MIQSELGKLTVGENEPVRLMGVINCSPESFYKGSVETKVREAVERARKMVESGADIIDIGGMSTAPYKETYITVEEELQRVLPVIKAINESVEVELSVDTQRSKVADEVLKAGASIINDVSGFREDTKMPEVVANHDASAIVMSQVDSPNTKPVQDPIKATKRVLKEPLKIAEKHGIDPDKIVVDPGIGFSRSENTGWHWVEWDTYLLRELHRLLTLRKPILVGASRKSFIGEITGRDSPKERTIGSVTSEAIAVLHHAHVIRTHNIPESLEAVKIAEKIKKERKRSKKGIFTGVELNRMKKNDIEALLREEIDVHPAGAQIMSGKGVFKNLLVKNVPNVLALVLKQEMLSAGGEVAIPKEAIFGGERQVDVLLMGTLQQLEKLVTKLKQMTFNYLKDRGADAPDLAELISCFLPMDRKK